MRVLFLLFLTFSAFSANSQFRNRASIWDKVYFSPGNISPIIEVSQNETILGGGISPAVGYKLTERLSAGVSITYFYIHQKTKISNNQDITVSFTHYGGGPFARFIITEQFFAMTQYEYLSIEVYAPIPSDLENTFRTGVNSWQVGGGFVQQLGGNTTFVVAAAYDLLHDPSESISSRPFRIQAGINVGF